MTLVMNSYTDTRSAAKVDRWPPETFTATDKNASTATCEDIPLWWTTRTRTASATGYCVSTQTAKKTRWGFDLWSCDVW